MILGKGSGKRSKREVNNNEIENDEYSSLMQSAASGGNAVDFVSQAAALTRGPGGRDLSTAATASGGGNSNSKSKGGGK